MKTLTTLFLTAALALASSAFAAQPVDVTRLQYPKLHELQVPEITRVKLANGIRLYLVEDHALPTFSMAVRINCGAYLEPADKIGLVALLGQTLRTGGTSTRTGDELDELLEGIGASVETSGGTTTCGASVRTLSEYAPLGLEVLADVLRNPVFNQDKIELAKVGMRSAISRRNDQPRQIADREFAKLIFGADSPYARQAEYSTVDAITRDDLVNFHQTWFHPENMQFAVWGDFDRKSLVKQIEKLFGDWKPGTAKVPLPPKVDYQYKQQVCLVEKPELNQSQILLGHIGGLMTDPDYPDRIVMNTIIGGGFGSRMVDAVRSREGLAYTANSVYSANFDRPGIFNNYVATKSRSTGKAIQEMIKVIKSMQTEPPSDEELSQAKNTYLNSFVFLFDSPSKIVNRIMDYDFYGLPDDFLQKVRDRVERVTASDVVTAARKNLRPDAMELLVVGKSEDFDIPLDSLGFGPIQRIDVAIPAKETKTETGQKPGKVGKS